MSTPSIDKAAFFKRTKRFYDAWKEGDGSWGQTDAVIVCVGDTQNVVYSKSTCLQAWLLGYELTHCCMAFCEKDIICLASRKKVEFLSQVELAKENTESVPPITFLNRDKGDKDAANFSKVIELIRKSKKGKTIGIFPKDKFDGDFYDDFMNVLKAAEFEKIDLSVQCALLFAVKDESEVQLIKKACTVTCDVYSKYTKMEIINAVDSEKALKHSKLARGFEEALQNKKYVSGIDTSQLDVCYPPIIQSGGKYSLKFSLVSDKENLSFDCILCSVGARYKNYCSNISRTLLVDPTDEMQQNYELILEAEEAVIAALKPGSSFSDVYNAALNLITERKPNLADKFIKNVGFVTGIEFREGSLLLSPKTKATVCEGMVFCITLGFSDLVDSTSGDNKKYALMLSDTVYVSSSSPTVLTSAKKRFKNAAIFLKDEEDKSEEEVIPEPDVIGRSAKRTTILESRTRGDSEDKRAVHQRELAAKLTDDLRERLLGKKTDVEEKKTRKSNVAYKSYNSMPKEKELVQQLLYVDKQHESLILPLWGSPSPFHVSMVKNVTHSVEGSYTYLRINFFHPGATLGKNDGSFQNPNAVFIKELTYRAINKKEPGEISAPSSNLTTTLRLFKDVQRVFKQRETESRELEGVVKQDSLTVHPNRNNPRIRDLYIRPNIVSKRITGTLEAHVNGFRYTSMRGDKVDILYNNIRHAFYQSCDGEMIIILHFHLKNHIIYGKKKHLNVQFYTEVGEITTDLGKHQHMHDRDDLIAEQAERELRQKLKQTFASFCDKVTALTKDEIDFDKPYPQLGFTGTPFRSACQVQPTTYALVNLTEWPPFVVTLSDVELVHFERVSFHLKNFDMVIVLKDYSRKPLTINAIPQTSIEDIRDWLNSVDIHYTEGLSTLNWAKIMKAITDDPEGFIETGCWSFLEDRVEDDDADSHSEEEDENYEPDGSESNFDSDDDGSDWGSESSEEEMESDWEGEELGSDESEGKDWDELEEEAREDDEDMEVEGHGSRKRKHDGHGSVQKSKKSKHDGHNSVLKSKKSSHHGHDSAHKSKHSSPKKSHKSGKKKR